MSSCRYDETKSTYIKFLMKFQKEKETYFDNKIKLNNLILIIIKQSKEERERKRFSLFRNKITGKTPNTLLGCCTWIRQVKVISKLQRIIFVLNFKTTKKTTTKSYHIYIIISLYINFSTFFLKKNTHTHKTNPLFRTWKHKNFTTLTNNMKIKSNNGI